MSESAPLPLLIGEIYVDVTVTPRGAENKLRLGGVAHAARGFWAQDQSFDAAVIVPKYLERSAEKYLTSLGCQRFFVLGYITGAPNVILIFDPTEVDDQEYETLLRDEKTVEFVDGFDPGQLERVNDVLVFPGAYDLSIVKALLPSSAKIHIDAAYDVTDIETLKLLGRPASTIFLSTSSPLFEGFRDRNLDALVAAFSELNPEAIILKENRGGARLHLLPASVTEEIPAHLGQTVNSVGVGDVFDAAYVVHLDSGPTNAAWRAASASSAYAQTTEPDLFRKYVRRDSALDLSTLKSLGGSVLSWEDRQNFPIYLAAPDFANADRHAIDRAISALEYHNFTVRRPVVENGELPLGADSIALAQTYRSDTALLKACSLVFAVPTGRDPGTLVEIGLAIESGIPVVVYDPAMECNNTMVVAGSRCYSQSLDECLNETFQALSDIRARGR